MDWTVIKYLVSAATPLVALLLIVIIIKVNKHNDVLLNKHGLIVRAKTKRWLSSKNFLTIMKEVILYIEEAKEQYVDDVIGIKNRYFKQSKDFAKSRIESVKNDIIEENHLINRADREYEEEIMSKAEQLSTYLRNTIISYPVPIDNKIAKQVIDHRCHEVKEAIADALRRSRTLSITKREVINEEKKRYFEKRNRQIAQIVNILSEEDTEALLDTELLEDD